MIVGLVEIEQKELALNDLFIILLKYFNIFLEFIG